jgi:hypothetical protein
MTHHISGFIGPEEHLKTQTKDLMYAQVIPLAQGMAFLPLGDELYDEICKYNRQPMKWLAKKLGEDHIAWIETDYFGGFGEQSAILWKDGKKKRYRKRFGGNIDEALKELGVVCEGSDEFDALGLGKHRLNDAWLGKEYG